MMLNDMGMICLLKNFLKMVLVSIPQHNVHQMHTIQVLLIIILMLFEKKKWKIWFIDDDIKGSMCSRKYSKI